VPRTRAILWDFGHTLVDWDPARVYRALLDTDDAVEAFLGGVCSMEWHGAHDRGVPMAENRKALIEAHPDKADLITAWDTQWDAMFDGWVTGMGEIVATLETAQIPQFGLTNLPAEKWPNLKAMYPPISRFTEVVVSGEEGVVKPDRRIFEITDQRLPFEPAEVLFFDDRLDNIEAARAYGFDAEVFVDADKVRVALRQRALAF
jgi:FMN phosphatase YigB (HAD superfamily)